MPLDEIFIYIILALFFICSMLPFVMLGIWLTTR